MKTSIDDALDLLCGATGASSSQTVVVMDRRILREALAEPLFADPRVLYHAHAAKAFAPPPEPQRAPNRSQRRRARR